MATVVGLPCWHFIQILSANIAYFIFMRSSKVVKMENEMTFQFCIPTRKYCMYLVKDASIYRLRDFIVYYIRWNLIKIYTQMNILKRLFDIFLVWVRAVKNWIFLGVRCQLLRANYLSNIHCNHFSIFKCAATMFDNFATNCLTKF